MTDKIQTKVYLPPDVKAMLDADSRNNSEAVESALITEYGGERDEALERRIEEKKRRVSMIESEKNERERELRELRSEVNGLEEQLEEQTNWQDEKLDELAETVNRSARTEDNPAIKNWSEKLGMDTSNVVDELNSRDERDYR